MKGKKKYTQTDLDNYVEATRSECESTMLRQRERIDELKKSLADAESKIAQYESQKALVYKAITSALKKADDIERVSLIKYNQEIAQLKSFHEKWQSYYNQIIAAYPLDDELVEASKVNRKISEVLSRAGDIEGQYEKERERLQQSLDEEDDDGDEGQEASAAVDDEYTDRSPAGFSFAEALHPKEDLKDIMRELGVIMDDDDN
ncbi:MAG: hypothetical protein K2J01_02070 [Clostridiales bacterium]|nr:hypothetical protein [Clostridiales bacterium]